MWKLIAFALGYWLGERQRGGASTRAQRSGASGWLTAFLVLLGLLAFAHVKIGPAPDACDAHCHTALRSLP